MLALLTVLGAGCEGTLGIVGNGAEPPTLRERDAGVRADAAFVPVLTDAATPPPPPPPALDAATPPPPPPPPVGCGTAPEQEVLALANGARTSMGLSQLTCDPLMTTVARAHSQDMCDQGYFDHTARDGRSPFDRMRDAGVRFGTAGENIAQGQRSPDEVHTSWMNSSGHRMNILGGGYRRLASASQSAAGACT